MAEITLPGDDVLTWPHHVLADILARDEGDIPDLIDRAAKQREALASGGLGELPGDPESLLSYAKAWEGCAARYDESDIPAEDADWRLESEYPIDALLALMEDGKAGWIEWFRTENTWAREDGRNGYADLLLEEIEEEVVLLELEDGRVDVWDGWHRLGAQIVKGELTIGAVVGTPKPELKPTPR